MQGVQNDAEVMNLTHNELADHFKAYMLENNISSCSIKELCALVIGHTWQPIKTAPRDGTSILVRRGQSISLAIGVTFTRTEATKVYFNRDAQEASKMWMVCDTPLDVYVLNPTEWMPLPE